jgi:hypothetical protein
MPGAPYPRFPVEFCGFPELHAPFLEERRTRGPVQCCVQEIRGICLVLADVGYRRPPPQASYGLHNYVRVPYVRTSVRGPKTMGDPDFLLEALARATCAAFIKESRMKFRGASKLNRKSGGSPNDCFVHAAESIRNKSFSAHVRWCERRAPVQSGDGRSLGLRGDG